MGTLENSYVSKPYFKEKYTNEVLTGLAVWVLWR